ncbi:MAG TPA: DNA polymerase III subunit epsilon, partial [Accumulibacter sp.]|nr:DNA polymerase III subunit epsilon [Accumulibacter sp.]
MTPPPKLIRATLLACLFVLLAMLATAGLLIATAQESVSAGERWMTVLVLALAACALVAWQMTRLYERYVAAPLRMVEEVASASAHGNLRLGEYPGSELQSLARSVNQLLDRRDALQNDVDERIHEARASLEEERSRLAALMTELSQSVVVCNLD